MADLFYKKSQDWDTREVVQTLSSAVGSAILKNVPLDEQMHVMDFGAGTGLISSQIIPFVETIVAVDTSESMLNKLVKKPELEHKVKIVCQDIIDNVLTEKFDLIVSAMAMHHIEDTEKLFQRFAQQLNPGGMIALADLEKEDGSFHEEGTEGIFHNGFERNDLQSISEKYGFEEISFETVHTINKEDRCYPMFLLIATYQPNLIA